MLHGLLEMGGRLGILTLGDLFEAVRARSRPHFGKIRLTDHLPHAPGVYMFRATDGRVLYVGKAVDLRARAKSYFYGDGRKKIEDLLAETASVQGIECRSEVEALALEARLIGEHEPKYNRRGKTWRRYAYLKIDPSEAFPRIKVVHEARATGTFLGPFRSSLRARLAKDALEEAFPIRRCTRPMRASTRFSPCALAELGKCTAPCDGRIAPERYGELVRTLIASLSSPGGLLEALEQRMTRLAAAERYEEAGVARDRLQALAEAIHRNRAEAWLAGSERVVVRDAAGAELRLRGGSLEIAGAATERIGLPVPRGRADELVAVRGWLARNPPRLEDADPPLSEPVDGGAALARILAVTRAALRQEPG